MCIQGSQSVPLSLRSHMAVIPLRSGLTVRVDRTAPLASAEEGCATGAMSAPPIFLSDAFEPWFGGVQGIHGCRRPGR